MKTDEVFILTAENGSGISQKVWELLYHMDTVSSKFMSAGVRHHHHALQKGFWQCRRVGFRSKRTSAWQIVGKSWVVQMPKKATEKVQKKRHMFLWTVASSSLYSMIQGRSMIKYLETLLSHLNFLASKLPHLCLLYLFTFNFGWILFWNIWETPSILWLKTDYLLKDFCFLNILLINVDTVL